VGDFGQAYFWAKIKGGVEKKVKKLKKKRQKVFTKREKRGNVRKIEKNDAKRRTICGVFSKSDKIPLKRRGGFERIVAKCL